jgi:hypothetical protein
MAQGTSAQSSVPLSRAISANLASICVFDSSMPVSAQVTAQWVRNWLALELSPAAGRLPESRQWAKLATLGEGVDSSAAGEAEVLNKEKTIMFSIYLFG